MAKYIVIKTFKSPVVYSGGSHPKLQAQVKYMTFKKGTVLDGTLKTKANGEPDYVIHKGCVVVPIAAVKELVTKAIVTSNADGNSSSDTPKTKSIIPESKSKVRYIDSAIIGGLIGLGVVWFAEKKGWLVEAAESKIPHQNKLVGIAVGGLLGAYFTFRKNIQTGIKVVKDK
jgi:hypothetical protein